MSAIDLFARLDGIDTARLTPLQRILLITDGTLTEILEAHFLERIELVKISERMLRVEECGSSFAADACEPVMERKINLRGAQSGLRYVYAESLVLVNRLESSFQTELLETNVPLGRLWRRHRLETYKEPVGIGTHDAADFQAHLDGAEGASVLGRTYDVFSARRLVMRISEYFCASARA